MRNHGTLGSDGVCFQQNPSQAWYPRRQTGWRRTPGGGSCDDNLRQDKGQIALRRDFLKGRCTHGASCKYEHSESDKHVGCGVFRNNQENLGAVANLGNSQFDEANKNSHSRTRSYPRGLSSRSPCRKFLRGTCRRGASCPHFHPEFAKHDRLKYHWSTGQQLGVVPTFRNPDFGEGTIINTSMISQEHDEARKDNDTRTQPSLKGPRSRYPCRKFLRGTCQCRYDCSRQGDMEVAVPRRDSGSGEGNMDKTSRRFQEHEEPRKKNDTRRCFPQEPKSRSCHKFLRGMCNRGATCQYLHPTLTKHNRQRYDCNTQQRQGVAAISGNPGFGDGRRDVTLRTPEDCDMVKSDGLQPCQGVHAGINFFVDDIALGVQNKAWNLNDAMQYASDRDNLDVTLRSLSTETYRSRPAGECSGDKLRQKVCLKLPRGRCTRGESCKYLHGGFNGHARSTSHCTEQPQFYAAEALRDFGGANQYGSTVTSQGHDDVERKNIQFSSCKLDGSSFASTNGSFDEKTEGKCDGKTKRKYAKPNSLDNKFEALVMNGLKHDIYSDGSAINCNGAEGNNNISLWSRPLKRRKSMSISSFTCKDDFVCRKLERDDSQTNFSSSRSYNVAPLQYEYCSSYKFDRPRYHISSQQQSQNAATNLVDPCSNGVNKNFNLMEPQRSDEVESNGMHLDQYPGDSSAPHPAVLSEKAEAESGKDGLQVSHVTQDVQALVPSRNATDISKQANDIDAEVEESNAVIACETHHITPKDTNMSVLNEDDDAGVNIKVSKEGNEKTGEIKQGLKSSRKRRRKRRSRSSKCCIESMKEQVIDTLKQGLASSVAETSLSHPDIVSIPGILEDMKKSEHQVQKLELEIGVIKNKMQNNAGSALAVMECEALLVGDIEKHSVQTSESSSKAESPNSRRKLLVLDVNGLLADIVAVVPRGYKPDTRVSGKGVFKRPFCDDFLQFCFERFDVGVWSSRIKKNLNRVVDFLMGKTKERLLFCWDQSHCTITGYKTMENKDKPLVLKELKILWERQGTDLPWEKGLYDETNTILLDDSPYKALCNPPFTAIFPPPYTFKNVRDKSLGPGGDLRVYLEGLADAENVPKFVQENPFGQRPITKSSSSWGFYAKIVNAYATVQKGNASQLLLPPS